MRLTWFAVLALTSSLVGCSNRSDAAVPGGKRRIVDSAGGTVALGIDDRKPYRQVQTSAAGGIAGTLSLAGTNPTCTVVRQDVEYHCALAKAPAPEVSDWKGTVEPTVDRTKHVNGGCRSLASDGREWECYTGQTAVAQKIIGPDFLGEFAPSPGQG